MTDAKTIRTASCLAVLTLCIPSPTAAAQDVTISTGGGKIAVTAGDAKGPGKGEISRLDVASEAAYEIRLGDDPEPFDRLVVRFRNGNKVEIRRGDDGDLVVIVNNLKVDLFCKDRCKGAGMPKQLNGAWETCRLYRGKTATKCGGAAIVLDHPDS